MSFMNKKKGLIIKYAATLAIALSCVFIRGLSWEYFVTAAAGVLLVALLTNVLCHTKMWIAYVANSFILLLINTQYAVLFWGNTFVTPAMMNNLDSVEALGGKMLQYIITLVLVIVFSLLPVDRFKLKKKHLASAGVVCVVLYGIIFWNGMYSKEPVFALGNVLGQQLHRHRLAGEIAKITGGENDFFKNEVTDYVAKPQNLPDSPNVILIFTEGLSQHIIEDERNIMPNARALSEKSLVFKNYFNHTFATYMGLSGQLYSGYQENVYDPNHLIALQDIFGEYGYQTTFINTEPENPEFSRYLEDFEFDNLIWDMDNLEGINKNMSDKAAYEFMMKTALEQNAEEKPFFITMYTFGTHVSFDSAYEKFGDGKNPLLNRFYDLDVQLGNFIEAFENSPLFENTIFVFTTDHATYCDSDYTYTFPEYQPILSSLNRIPFYIYYRGVNAEKIDVNGRNSLDMAPTVLDYLDMSGKNCFLGESLFSPYENSSQFDTVYESFGDMYDTSGGKVQNLKIELRKDMEQGIAKYFAVKMKDSSITTKYLNKCRVFAEFVPTKFAIKVSVINAEKWDSLEHAIWSEENGQDDLQWYNHTGDGEFDKDTVIYLLNHSSAGKYYIHVYGSKDGKKEFISSTEFFIDKEALDNKRFFQTRYDSHKQNMNITITNPADWEYIKYAVWSEKDGQDDLNWFIQEKIGKPESEFNIDLSDYNDNGMYHLHVYAQKDEKLSRITVMTFEVPDAR